jgi:membrane protein YqaA with SNARE-associated domain
MSSLYFDNCPSFPYGLAMHDFLLSYGYPALFLLSFLAATLIPLGSEWLLVTMLLQQHNPLATVATATIGNYCGALSSYLIGIYGSDFIATKVLRMDSSSTRKAERFFAKYGSWSLLFSWLPIVGDPLCLVGGALKIPLGRFSLLVFTGKAVRYCAVSWLTLQGAKLLSH